MALIDIGNGVGVGDCVGAGDWVGVTVIVGVGVDGIGVAEWNTTTGGDCLVGLVATLGVTSDGMLSAVPAIQHPLRKIIKANTNKYERRNNNLSSLNIP